jgi:hypothetical protein
MVLLGALGPLHHPQAKRAAVIGLGTGATTAVLLGSPTIEQVDTIEIEPLMVEAAQLFRPRTDAVYLDARSRIVIDDARAHFSRSRARYDLVVSEPSNPWVSGVAGLFTVEFYRHVSAHLAPDGHFVQWLQLYEASPELASSIVLAFTSVFPEFKAYFTNEGDVALVARNDGQVPRLQAAALERMPVIQQHLRTLGITSAATLAAHETGRGNTIKLLAGSYGSPANSDYFPYVDQVAAEDRFRGKTAHALFSLRATPVPFLDFAGGAPDYAGRVTDASANMPGHVRNLASSWHGLRYLRGEALSAAETALLGSYVTDYALLRSWLGDCRFPAGTDGAWGSVVKVAADLNPGLDAQRAAAFWRSIADGRCRRLLSPAQLAWIELFAATGARQPAAVQQQAQRVLALDPGMPAAARAYATLAGVSANLAVGRRAEAAQLMAEQRAKLPPAQVETSGFRYLIQAMLARENPVAP